MHILFKSLLSNIAGAGASGTYICARAQLQCDLHFGVHSGRCVHTRTAPSTSNAHKPSTCPLNCSCPAHPSNFPHKQQFPGCICWCPCIDASIAPFPVPLPITISIPLPASNPPAAPLQPLVTSPSPHVPQLEQQHYSAKTFRCSKLHSFILSGKFPAKTHLHSHILIQFTCQTLHTLTLSSSTLCGNLDRMGYQQYAAWNL